MMADVVAAMLRAGGMNNVFSVPVPASLCAEPIVVAAGEYERTARPAGGERGTLGLRVLCVRNTLGEANDAAVRVREVLRDTDWERWAEAGDVRIFGMDAGYPAERGRDGSGRWVCAVDVELAVASDE